MASNSPAPPILQQLLQPANQAQYTDDKATKKAIQALKPEAGRLKVCDVWRKILAIYFPAVGVGHDFFEFYTRPEIVLQDKLCRISVGPGPASELSPPAFIMHCQQVSSGGWEKGWADEQENIREEVIARHKDLEMHGKGKSMWAAIAVGQWVQFYKYSAQFGWGVYIWPGDGRRAFHIWDDDLVIGQNLADIRRDIQSQA